MSIPRYANIGQIEGVRSTEQSAGIIIDGNVRDVLIPRYANIGQIEEVRSTEQSEEYLCRLYTGLYYL